MAKVAHKKSAPRTASRTPQRVSPMKPGMSGARNWATAQVRAATYTRKAFLRLVLSILFMLTLILYGALWLGGYLPNARLAAQNFSKSQLMSMGFVIKRVEVKGEGRLMETEVRKSLGVSYGDFLFDLDTKSAQSRIESLSWVDHAVVRRLWPDLIVVEIVERRPYALWQNHGLVKVVDIDGLPIEAADYMKFTTLPLIVGNEAAPWAKSWQVNLAEFPEIANRVEAIVRVNDQHWNLKMQKGSLWVQIADRDIRRALTLLARLQSERQILDRQISNIDLRLPDRITLTPLETKRV